VAQANLDEARTSLVALRDRLSLEVALRQADVTLAQEVTGDALKNLLGATVRAPFTGVISLVNVETDDDVNKNSHVIEIVDPSVLAVEGSVDADDVKFIKNGAKARVKVDSLPEQVLAGAVSAVANSPRTERGVVSYPVTIQVDVPEGVHIPVALSGVSAVVIHEEKSVLLVPRDAVQGTLTRPVVRVMNNGVIENRDVVLGSRDDTWVAVLAGLEEGDRVVV
jgi:RND family efflux transporter MFP subunit